MTRHHGAVEVGSLPQLVRAYAERAVEPDPRAETIRVTQVGEMVLKPGGAPRPFTAIEEFAVCRVSFTWRAKFGMFGPISMGVNDSYDGNNGRLEVRFLGVPVQRRRGSQVAQGEAYRYLAEIAWVPHAILANPELAWRTIDKRTVEVSTNVRSEKIGLRLIFNERGEITRTVAERPRLEAGNAPTPWIGEYAKYERIGGLLVPTHGQVSWELADGPFTYWRGKITSLAVHS
jgi:hypothetical protein